MTHLTQLLPAILAVFSMSIAMPTLADEGGRTLFDFARPDAAQVWQPVNDGVMGGVSDGRFKITDQGTMEFFGTLSLENNGGFASVRSRRSNLGLRTDDTLLIRLKGDGREYILNLYVPSLQIAYSYRAAIPTRAGEWAEVRVPLKDSYATSFGRNVPDAGPVDAPKINSIGFMVSDKKAGPFKLEVAWVKVVSASAVSGAGRTISNPPEGFKVVFNGRDLTGWEGSPAYWSVEDGCLTGKADGTLKYNRFLTWKGGTVRNFELRAKVKVSATGNSGLQYRGTERPDLGESVVTGYQCDVVANRPDYNGMLYEERGRRILAHTGENVVIDAQGQPWVVGQFPLKAFPPDEWHDYRVLAEGNHQRHWIDGHPTVDVIDLDETGRKLDGVLAVQVHVGPPMTIRYKDFFLKALPDDLPLIKPEQAVIPPDAPKVVPQGQDRPRKPDAE